MSVSPRGMSIQEAYREFREDSFRVNRKYQRKLVWTLEEKQQLVDSILHGYPIPLILLATRSNDEKRIFEILDGMQRLNALFSFIENRFSLKNGKYFDVGELSRAKQLSDQGLFKSVKEKDKLLDRDSCANFLEYTLAITEFPGVNEEEINEIFSRINSYGRQLSRQEKRQAGVVSPFAKVVREIASEVRGDPSPEDVPLAEMPEISIDIDGDLPENAIKAEDSFWCKQGILRKTQLRESEDEQMIADIVISILENKPFAFSGTALDSIYDPHEKGHSEINGQLISYGVDALKHGFISTYSIIRETLESYDSTPNALKRIVNPEDSSGNPVKTHFYSIFLAFFELCILEMKSPIDVGKIWGALRNLHARLDIARGSIKSESRRKNINTVKGLIRDHFEETKSLPAQLGIRLATRFETALKRSKIETAAFECKQGIVTLDKARTIETGLLDRIVNTICAIANIGPDSEGAIFLGVADNEKDKERIKEIDSVSALNVGQRFVVGIDREAKILGIDLDAYKKKIVSHIYNSKLSEHLKTSVQSSVDCINYRGHSVICIWIPPQKEASEVNDKLYIRVGSDTVVAEGLAKMRAVEALFKSKENK
ncbi:MAG TPA: DUF262 domain-containing protein [Oligoflexus sp.]|uniref:DUF262 domain-containing protein n=1 Tax=Oligoflexus sp. TaxID=1971216 RepID=UPI002D7E4F06|nr:DUF262 domain-containing protein [Oligoflexus sp.]HET9241393.1 DUF262 domain-containing protein [Oligoflexus sp.]